MQKSISGFSKLSKAEKINWLIANHFGNKKQAKTILESYWNEDKKLQQLHDEFIENTIKDDEQLKSIRKKLEVKYMNQNGVVQTL